MLCSMNRTQTITPNSNHSGVETLRGFSITEDSGAAGAYIRLRKGAVGGQIVVHLQLSVDQSANIEYLSGLTFEGGCYVEEVSGSVSGVLYY